MSAGVASAAREPLYEIDPWTGASIEVFFADRTLETFGRCGAGWFWWYRRRGFSPEGPARGLFPTSYSAYRDAMMHSLGQAERTRVPTVNADTVRTPSNIA